MGAAVAEIVVCPVCGETNPADMEFCRNCQSRLRPVGGESEAIQPGQLPTKKKTSELEPLLPQWLREARQKARDSESQEPGAFNDEPAEAPEPSGSDLLAGLASQSSDDEEDIPEWLANITGAQSKKKKPVPEDSQAKWVELGRAEQAPETSLDVESQGTQAAPEKDELSDWLRQATASSETADFRMPAPPSEEAQPPAEPAAPAEAEDLGWLRNLGAASAIPAEQHPASAPPPFEEAPDWLKGLQAEQAQPETPQPADTATPSQAAIPDWLKGFGEEMPPAEQTASQTGETRASEEPLFEPQLPDWLKSAEPGVGEGIKTEAPQPEKAHEEALPPVELPDWISALGGAQQSPAEETTNPTVPAFDVPEPEAETPATPAELPDWLASLRAEQGAAEEAEPRGAQAQMPTEAPAPATPVGLSDWLASLRAEAEQEHAGEETQPPEPQAIVPSESPTPAPAAELPNWLSSLGGEAEAAPESPAVPEEPGASETVLTPEVLSGEDADAIFASMQAPDWLSAVLPSSAPLEENVPAAASEEEPIVPAELPSWVQAMRPVESAMEPTTSATEAIATEAQGPLAGLRGVLPMIPGAVVPSSKPKAQSIKLVATEQQQAHAALLEQILAAETSPIPMRSAGELLRTQRVLRWVLSALLIVVLGGVVFAKTESFQLPSGVPNETVVAIQSVEAVPENAPVLLIFDYQPATVGEMEATGASLIDHLIVMRHPRIALLSTSATGPALAEHFMSTVIVDKGQPKYTRGVDYVDLGYLPGELAGVRRFAQNPSATLPFEAGTRGAQSVWGTGVLSHVERYSDFAAVIVLTDSVETGRTWVEQTQLERGNGLLVLVSSAQAGPMLMPYVDSGQVNGMVSGIYGAAGTEQRNAGSPGIYGLPGADDSNSQLPGYVRRYWDAYSVGLYLAVAAIVLGALVNMWLGFRDRRAGAVG